MVIFATCTEDRRIAFADVGPPGVLSDSTIFERSVLRQIIWYIVWLGNETPIMLLEILR